jgi:hypothetical protein
MIAKRIFTLDECWESFIAQFFNIDEAIEVMYWDVADMELKDERVNKLLRLASCPSSPVGEKTNAGKAVFRIIAKFVNQ